MTQSIQRVIYTTLAYADIFEYPLSEHEIWFWSLGLKYTKAEIHRALKILAGPVKKTVWYTLSGRKHIIKTRQLRFRASVVKYQIACDVSRYLLKVPTILMIGVTGGTAIHNADTNDDVDIFIVTRYGTLWITRFICMIILELFGVRRKAGQKEVPNSVCLNMLLDEGALHFTSGDQDVYNAHEILQMQPIYDREDTYIHILKSNTWIERLLPNAWNDTLRLYDQVGDKQMAPILQTNVLSRFISWCLYYIEPFFWKIQMWHMRNTKTTEIISPHIARFHPRDTHGIVKNEFTKRLIHLKLPLDKKILWTLK